MAINAVTASSVAAPAPSPFATLTERFDNFLLLLTKQLQYQDPLSPLDTNEFTSQLVQFTGVEQAIATNKKLDQIIDLQSSDQTSAAAALIGTTVQARGDGLWLADGHGEATYELSRNATVTTITILDARGKPVRVASGTTTMGKHTFAWNGKDNDGNALPSGVYRMQVTAVDGAGKTVEAVAATVGRVTGVRIRDGETLLGIGDLEVPLGDVTSIQEAQRAAI
ncbi:MAG: flagellar hook assembly protein FlgD [Dongiaceae bacterium]